MSFRDAMSTLRRRAARLRWRMSCELRALRFSSTLLPREADHVARTFDSVKGEALAMLRRLQSLERDPDNRTLVERYSSAFWVRERVGVQRYVAALDPSFRRSKALSRYMVCTSPRPPAIDRCWEYIFSRDDLLTERLRTGPVESRIGNPFLEYAGARGTYSTNTIEHVYYLARVLRNTEARWPESVCELGGGFGNLARLVQVFAPGTTYVDVDYPETLALAHVNLRLNFPDFPIVVHESGVPEIVEGAVNLVPLWLAQRVRFAPDLFISTFALSECGRDLVDLLTQRAFFDCRRLYLVGSVDDVFDTHSRITAAVGRLYGAETVRPWLKPYCYEAIGRRRPTPVRPRHSDSVVGG